MIGNRVIGVVAVLTAAAALAGCQLVNPTATPTESVSATDTGTPAPTVAQTTPPGGNPVGKLSGTWRGTWTNVEPIPGEGPFTLQWSEVGGHLFGRVTVEGPNCLAGGSVNGTVNGVQLRFGAVDGDVSIDYDGTVVNDNTIEGTYHSDCGPSSGTWTATRLTV